jgi:drug/metabolite transporter (DMT)-like permease
MTISSAPPLPRLGTRSNVGVLLVVASAAMLAALGIATQLAYRAGAPVALLLPGRFVVSASLLWLIVGLSPVKRPSAGQALSGLGLGAAYSVHAGLYSCSLTMLDAGLVDLVDYTYPILVSVWVVARRQDTWSRRRAIALAASTGGIAMVLMGGVQRIDPVGVALALGSAIAYAAYTVSSARALARNEPLMLTALVTTGAAITLTAGGAACGGLSAHCSVSAVLLVAAVGAIAVGGMAAFVTGIGRLGPARASIISAVQPAFTAVFGLVVFGDRLGPAQVAGGAIVIGAIVVLESGAAPPTSRPWGAWVPGWEQRVITRLATAIEVPAGSQLIAQGSPPDRFFIMEQGQALVIRDDRVVAQLGPGEFFGELALLRGGGRTATVVAGTDVCVRVLERRTFRGAMRALPHFTSAVRRVTENRLAPAGMPAVA